jgi:hypothetical protein
MIINSGKPMLNILPPPKFYTIIFPSIAMGSELNVQRNASSTKPFSILSDATTSDKDYPSHHFQMFFKNCKTSIKLILS